MTRATPEPRCRRGIPSRAVSPRKLVQHAARKGAFVLVISHPKCGVAIASERFPYRELEGGHGARRLKGRAATMVTVRQA